MEVYHGSHTKIDKIDLSKGQLNRNFGHGFYVTKIREKNVARNLRNVNDRISQ
jgi:hypothetical protein